METARFADASDVGGERQTDRGDSNCFGLNRYMDLVSVVMQEEDIW